MASRKSSKLIWRLFLPTTVLVWSIVGLLGWYSSYRERELRRDNLEMQLSNINATIIDAYDRGDDLQETCRALNYFTNNTTLNDLAISVYDDYGKHLAHIGTPILIEDSNHRMIPEIVRAEYEGCVTNIRPLIAGSPMSILNAMTSNDGYIRTIAAIPYNTNVQHALSYNMVIWLLVIALGCAATAMIFALSRKVSVSVNALHHFAVRAASGSAIDISRLKFTHDELGEVSREIAKLYLEKDKAMVRLEHEHKVALRAEEEKARIKRQTANNLNHELKTPVGIIKGYIDTILSDTEMPESLKMSFLQKAQAHADRLTQLLKDVSSITRLDEAGAQVEISVFDFHDLVYNIANDLEVSHINGEMEFQWNIPFDTYVAGNYTLVSNAIMNLVRNAAKYAHGTVMSLRLVSTDSKFCTFSFADDGNGVGEEHILHLFDRFYRVDEGRTRKSGGTGLGLPIVKSTFTALGGEVIVRNIRPHGLEFLFKLPKADKPE